MKNNTKCYSRAISSFKLASNFYFHSFSFGLVRFLAGSQLQGGIYLELNHRNWLSTLESIVQFIYPECATDADSGSRARAHTHTLAHTQAQKLISSMNIRTKAWRYHGALGIFIRCCIPCSTSSFSSSVSFHFIFQLTRWLTLFRRLNVECHYFMSCQLMLLAAAASTTGTSLWAWATTTNRESGKKTVQFKFLNLTIEYLFGNSN